MKFVIEFHSNCVLLRDSNASFIALVPKVDDPQSLGEFRLISLVSCLYKIFAKLLANRLMKVLNGVIDQKQNTFLKDRYLLHSTLVVNEVIDDARREKKEYLFFKANFEKANDLVCWDLLFYKLRRLGFGDKWIGWIKVWLQSNNISVLVNGSPTSEFVAQKGLRKGDPLALFLFNNVVEGFSGMMRQAIKKNIFSSYLVGNLKVEANLLQYADNTLFFFFVKAILSNVFTIKSMLGCFKLVSGSN